MHTTLQGNLFLVKEHVGMFKAANNYDIHDPQTGQVMLECREDNLGGFTKFFRYTRYKRSTPFDIKISDPGGEVLVQVKRGIPFLASKVDVLDGSGRRIGGFKQKLFTIGAKFVVTDASDQEIFTVKGSFVGWNFKILDPAGAQIGEVTKKWAGLGKELFTSADNYVLAVDESIGADDPRRPLIVAAVMCIDMVLAE